MRTVYRMAFSDPQFWAAVVAGWVVCALLWKSEDINTHSQESTHKCRPCVNKVCTKCESDKTDTRQTRGSEFYRDYPWKPLNAGEGESNVWKTISKKYRDGMQNEDPRVGTNGMWRMDYEQVDEYLRSEVEMTYNEQSVKETLLKRVMRKYDPFYGVSYVVEIDSTRSEKDGHVDTSAYEIRRKFKSGKPTLIDIKNNRENEVVHIITPLSKVTERFHKFLRRLEQNIYSTRKPSYEKLIFVIFGDPKSQDAIQTVSALQAFQLRNPAAIMQHTFVDGDFSRAIGLDTGVKLCPDNALMLFLDVDLSISHQFLNRVRWNTVRHESVVFPIMFSQFDPDVIDTYMKTVWVPTTEVNDSPVGEDKGFWIYYAFGVASMYKSDYLSVGGFPLDIAGWGGEDVKLFKKFIASPTLDVMSTVDPDLIHIYHQRTCDVKLSPDQYRMCIGALSETIGSQVQIGTLYLKTKKAEYFGGTFG